MNFKMIVFTVIFSAGSIAMHETAANHHDNGHSPEKEQQDEHHNKEYDTSEEIPGEGLTTAEFYVRGNCGMCKQRIEKALNELEGVESSEWDVDSKKATVTYDAEKLGEKDLHKATAEAGHKTHEVEADEAAYKALPGCCR